MESALKPILTPQVQYIDTTNAPADGYCLVCALDADGNEVDGSEFTTSIRQWDKSYNNSNFKLKKK